MNANRIRKLLDEAVHEEPAEAFIECPAFFLEGLSPEQFRARQQVYQRAYEQARARLGNGISNDDYSI